MPRVQLPAVTPKRKAWNKGRIIGQKRPLMPKQVWAIRARLELAGYLRDLALFNVAIDSKLRGCDLVKLTVGGLVKDDRVRKRISVIQSKTKRPVQFELGETHVKPSWPGSSHPRCLRVGSCSPAGPMIGHITRPVSMDDWCVTGSRRSGWSRADMVGILCVAQRQRKSIEKLVTTARSNCCLVTPRLIVPRVTLASS